MRLTLRRIRSLNLLFGFAILILAPTAFGQSAPTPSNIWPPYLTPKTDTSVTVNWKAAIPSRGSLIFYREPNGKEGIRLTEDKTFLYHHISLENLVPGSLYSYEVSRVNLREMKKQPIQFRMPFGSEALTFFVISDTHQVLPVPGINETVRMRTQMVVDAMLRDPLVPDFFVNCGDHVESDALPNWTAYFKTIYPLACKIPTFPVLGNHEDMSGADNYFHAFSFPDGGGRQGWEWYTFQRKNVLLVFLNMNFEDLDHITRQTNWLKSVLNQSRDKTWKFVFTHQPLYSSSVRYSAETPYKMLLEPIFMKHGVDVVFSGHHHAYQRVYRNGITHIVSGGGGGDWSELTLREKKIEGTVKTHEKALHYLRVRVVKNNFIMEMRIVGQENAEGVIEPRDEIIDRFEIVKR
ncbi:MAG: metallophosphoesterase [Desulfobacterales bacterium]|nr:metallophosphoesterase [Desulfobacterales bacterium]